MSKFSKMYNPFDYIAGSKAFFIGILVLLFSVVTGFYFNARFDGVINLHFSEDVQFTQVLFDQVVNMLCLIFTLYVLALAFGAKETRIIDVAGTSLLALIPFAIAPILNVDGFFFQISNDLVAQAMNNESSAADAMIWILPLSLTLIALMVWHVAMLFHAYKTSTNLKSGKLIGSFILGLVLAMVSSIYLTRNFSF